MIKKIDHIAIAVRNIEEAAKLYRDVLGLEVKEIETVEEQKVRTAIIPVGESKIELIEATDPAGTVAKYIEKRGEGLHHIALQVDNIQETLEALNAKDIPLIDKEPRTGVGNTKIAFLHPRTTKVLIEVVEPQE